jgi:hypothetical protein
MIPLFWTALALDAVLLAVLLVLSLAGSGHSNGGVKWHPVLHHCPRADRGRLRADVPQDDGAGQTNGRLVDRHRARSVARDDTPAERDNRPRERCFSIGDDTGSFTQLSPFSDPALRSGYDSLSAARRP